MKEMFDFSSDLIKSKYYDNSHKLLVSKKKKKQLVFLLKKCFHSK